MKPVELVLSKLPSAQASGKYWRARCPAHDDRKPSLSIWEKDDGSAGVQCHAGCQLEAVFQALGLSWKDLKPVVPDQTTPICRKMKTSKQIKANDQTFVTADAAVSALRRTFGQLSASWPYHDPHGNEAVHVLRWESKNNGKTFRPIYWDGDIWRIGAKPESRLIYRLPEIIPAQRVFVCEGEKAADALRTLGLVATTSPHGANSANKADWSPLAGKEVVIWPDNDEPGRKYAADVQRCLSTLYPPPIVKLLELEGLPEKGDAFDWVEQRDATEAELLRTQLVQLADHAPVSAVDGSASSGDNRLDVILSTDEFRTIEEVVVALKSDHSLYFHSGRLVTIINDGGHTATTIFPKASVRIAEIQEPMLRERITRYCRLLKRNGEYTVPAHPPPWLTKGVLYRKHWPGLRLLSGIVTTPVLRPDSSILETPGYDSTTGLYLAPMGLSVNTPRTPTLLESQNAAKELLDVFCDFPFEAEHHRSALLAAILTGFSRHAITGPVPMFLIDANVRGCGKSLMADVIGAILTGDNFPRLPNSRNEEETVKQITALAIQGDNFCLIDNVIGELGGPAFDAALTGTQWRGRILGRSEMVDLPLFITWFATGNNVALAADTSRRVCHIRLNSLKERPEESTDFLHKDLRGHIQTNRAKLITAALTILRGFHVANRPQAKLPGWGSFEGWTALIRQCLVWLGMPDPAAGRVSLMERSDTQAIALRHLLELWQELGPSPKGVTSSELIQKLKDNKNCHGVLEAILELCGGTVDELTTQKVGTQLKSLRRRVVGGRMLDAVENRNGVMAWKIVTAQ